MDPLAELKDIHLPQAVSNWPPAWGWWLLAIFIVLLCAALIRWFVKRHQKRLAIRQALQLLKQLDKTQGDYPQQLNRLLKRLSLSYYDREQIAQLHQQAWLDFLCQQLPSKKRELFAENYQPLLNSLYSPVTNELDHQQLESTVSQWIKQVLPPKKRSVQHV
ncbi:DUF4381 domain-containing protein [Alteromonadaceae bacterium BrNp21-10]|nr:DUF4381 domain-containing protein [Alteromonadaceae bacterium BrNp21-10]